MTDRTRDPLHAFRATNVAGTLKLAQEAAESGVSRFVYLSSIKVNGEETPADSYFSAGDEPKPLDAYGISKMEAEVGLRKIADRTGMGVVIIRPPWYTAPA